MIVPWLVLFLYKLLIINMNKKFPDNSFVVLTSFRAVIGKV